MDPYAECLVCDGTGAVDKNNCAACGGWGATMPFCVTPVISSESWGGGDLREVDCGQCEGCLAVDHEVGT